MLIDIPLGQRTGVIHSASQSFLSAQARLPRRLLDARGDFGARGDGVADDSAAIQKTIDAAAAASGDAIAYLPTGNYVITRTWTSVDDCGNSSSCVQTITVTDTHGPSITCPADKAIDCTESTLPANTGSATASDDCSNASTPTYSDKVAAGNCAGNYVITRTWTSVDDCGNASSCVQTITVTDTHGPSITCLRQLPT